ncbi:diguanylate cyclase [Sulfurimonas aquatica]|uniref:diguanylate cyclase n=1 Tax=Sulfurimonas aquatica TaxID=2672570 RepID=A0A975AZQ5_9BACT|nr:GGDEF domain-containing protein [Sulfurimonas aquatica]QSZ41566.1 diguanylate cyclase [Sulfurimonas aquatica]
MQKDELKSLINKMYYELTDKIDSQDGTSARDISSYLCASSKSILDADCKGTTSEIHADLEFKSIYEDIAKESLLSYKNTNNKFQELAQLHKQTIENSSYLQIDIPKISEKFKDIQEHMMSEVQQANDVINNLMNKIKELEQNSNLDSLTKIFNRRALSTFLDDLCLKETNKYDLHLLILDVDDFKQINDTYGHIAGDKILIFIANLLRKTLRDGDKVFRFGGEEFVIILNRIDMKTSVDVTDRILALISSNKFIYKGESLNVTMSIGKTIYYQDDTPDSILNRADKALYKSKKNGKNQITTELK